jgi:hypothetical protein
LLSELRTLLGNDAVRIETPRAPAASSNGHAPAFATPAR